MLRTCLLLSFCALAASLPGRPALAGAQLPCADYRAVKQQLGARYDEAPVSLGVQSDGNLLQVFTSARTGTWTVISMAPTGLACILAAGRAWEQKPQGPPDPAA